MTEIKSNNFLEDIIDHQIKDGEWANGILTRFPPEPNGFLHLGHAKSICLNFGLAKKYNGKTNLRFDDTNPVAEEAAYVDAIKKDVLWLGFEWHRECYASDYFMKLYELAVLLIKNNLAYVDDSTAEEISKMKGDRHLQGTESKFRNRSISENLELFEAMKAGKFFDGQKVLRAKIDMTSPNMHLRDPIIYRIKKETHHRTQNEWCIYPMYDFAHGQSDAIENITHSVCTLEFETHKPLYEWLIKKLELFPSKQYEFARLNLTYTLMSKRKLLQLVNEKIVEGWDDPRMPTIAGIRRRGYTPEAIKKFCETIGVARRENKIDAAVLENCIREELNVTAQRIMAVLDPVEVEITNYADHESEILFADNFASHDEHNARQITFSKNLWIEYDDFMELPQKKFFRLSPNSMVRLKNAYIIQFEKCDKDEVGNIKKIYCKYIPESKSGQDTSGIAVKGVIHWVDKNNCTNAEVRLYDRLFLIENPSDSTLPLNEIINPNSLHIIKNAQIEKNIETIDVETKMQFMRKGYFCFDEKSQPQQLVFNRIVGLKDSWTKEVSKD